MKLSYLIKGTPGHPLHPPLTDAVIGAYTVAAVLAVVDVVGLAERNAASGWWLALVVGLILTAPTVLAGVADWLEISRGTPLWRTATMHMAANATATAFFLVAAIVGHDGYTRGDVTAGAFVLTLVGFAFLTIGGWLGGTIVYVHGLRVAKLPEEPTARAVSPAPQPETEAAESG